MDRIESFRVFIRLVECRSFTKTAEALRMPRSTVSTVIRELEERVGTQLLHRTTRRVSPTADGSAFYERCLRLLEDFEETESLFRRHLAQPRGRLRVTMPARIARRVVAPALPDFFALYPGIEIDLGATDRTPDLVEEGIDCAVRVGALQDSSLVARKLGDLALCNCASPGYLETYGRPETVEDLQQHVAVNYVSPASGLAEDWEYTHDGREYWLPMNSQVTVDNAESYIACALAGLGLIQVPSYDVQDDIASGRLVEVMPAFRPGSMPLSIVYPYRRQGSRRLQAFVHWMEDLFKDKLNKAGPRPGFSGI